MSGPPTRCHDAAAAIFLLGDLFDFWFEYKHAVPKGFVRVLGKLAELRDEGIAIYFFVGNHDMWMGNYFQKELNIAVFYRPEEFSLNGKLFLVDFTDTSFHFVYCIVDWF